MRRKRRKRRSRGGRRVKCFFFFRSFFPSSSLNVAFFVIQRQCKYYSDRRRMKRGKPSREEKGPTAQRRSFASPQARTRTPLLVPPALLLLLGLSSGTVPSRRRIAVTSDSGVLTPKVSESGRGDGAVFPSTCGKVG